MRSVIRYATAWLILCIGAAAQTTDLALVNANMGRATPVPNGEVVLFPHLTLAPSRKTVLPGTTVTVAANGATNPITWFMIDRPSGGTLAALDTTSAVYQAGAASSCIDVLEAWDGLNQFGRGYFNVISPEDMAAAGRAVIIAGRRSADDTLWPVTDYLAGNAFNVLAYRGFSKELIQYMSPVTDRDVDLNGLLDDIDAETTSNNVALTFTNWVNNSSKLFVYLVDHGSASSGQGFFRLNATETLSAAALANVWLDRLQDTYHTEVTVLIDCCYAGALLNELSYTGTAKRVVIAAAGTNEPAYFIAGGLVSFSDAFFGGIMLGSSVEQAYYQAQSSMSLYQNPLYADNGSGHIASNLYLGATFVAGKDIPYIGLVCGKQLLSSSAAATLWADDVISAYGIDRVWCSVIPPSHNPTNPALPILDVPDVDLTYNTTAGRYEGMYDGFSEQGTYKVVYYARDTWGSVSLPQPSYVIQSGYNEQVILLAGGATSDVHWAQIHNVATYAYQTFQTRLFDPSRVFYMSAAGNQDLSGDGTNDVRSPPSLASLAYAITNWASTTNWGGPAEKLTVYLLGDASNQALRVNASETLSAAALDGWLDSFQISNREVFVVMDYPGAGSYIPGLRPPSEQHRICIAGTQPGGICLWSNDGMISFSRTFLSGIFRGQTIWDAFSGAQTAMRKSSNKQQLAQLDDNGDGVANPNEDHQFAATRYIGPVFRTGADLPVVGIVMPDLLLAGVRTATVWAADVTDAVGITNVWCVITPPDYAGQGDLPQTNLAWTAPNGRYEAAYTNFSLPGSYVCTFFARNLQGDVSAPAQSEVVVGDAYEFDDSSLQAHGINVGDVERHSFHSSNDMDWVKFYAITDYQYTVTTVQQGTNGNTMLDVYYELPDGTLTNVDPAVNFVGKGTGQTEVTWIDYQQAGIYYVRISAATSGCWGPGSEYDLSIIVNVGGGTLIVVAADKLAPNQSPPGAVATVDGHGSKAFKGATSVSWSNLDPGTYTVRVPPVAGYIAEEDPAVPNQVGNPASSLYGNPKQSAAGDSPWRFAVFQFVPVGRAIGVVRDAWTGARISGAKLAFRARNGVIANLVYDGYPNGATYKSNWYSAADGQFPTNVWLPTVGWDLTISRPDYSNGVLPCAIGGMSPGALTNLGTLWLTPVDSNRNGVADSWEARYGKGVPLSMAGDGDGDGADNRSEYLSGTDPTDRGSVLKLDRVEPLATDGFRLAWPVVPGYTYRALAADALTSGLWPMTNGPWEATNGQLYMLWIDTNALRGTNRFYRIDVLTP